MTSQMPDESVLVRRELRTLAVSTRVLAVVIAMGSTAMAYRFGKGPEPKSPPQRPSTSARAIDDGVREGGGTEPAPRVNGGVEYEVALRLVDVANDARFDMPRADEARAVMNAHWSRHAPPFVPLSGDAVRFVTTIALRTSASEPHWAIPVKTEGESPKPDVRSSTMNEGSVDQREALVSPVPGTASFRVSVPRGAKLTFAEGTVNAIDEAIAFVVSVVDVQGALRPVCRDVLPPSSARRWTEASCDLDAYAGQDIELRLTTEMATSAESVSSTPVALWGTPTLMARTTPRVPWNVLWIVVDALRSDVLESFHDDAEDRAKEAAPWPPLDALLPKVPGLAPEIDELTKQGVRFTQAYSAGSWTRPATLAMFSGALPGELGIDATEWVTPPERAARFYGADPPLLARSLRHQRVTTRAFVNNRFMAADAPVGLDMGFERVVDHRDRTRDTLEITEDATRWIQANKDTRFFLFVNYNSPRAPYEPSARNLERVPPSPVGPTDRTARLYMGAAAKDDEAIGVLVRTLDESGLRGRTIIVVTASHGETMAFAHDETRRLQGASIREHLSVSNFEETTKVPIVMVVPGVFRPNTEVKARVRTIDIAPTLLDLLGIEPHARTSGKSLVALARGQPEAEERVVVSEGRGTRALMYGQWRLLVREGAARVVVNGGKKHESSVELYDLVSDPGERHDLAARRPEIVAEMKARLEAALHGAPVAGGPRPVASPGASNDASPNDSIVGDVAKLPVVHLRFVGGSLPRRVSGTITIGDGKTKPKTYDVQPASLGREALRREDARFDVAFRTSPSAPVGFDVTVDPPTTPVMWELWLDDKPWPEQGVFGGSFGLSAPSLKNGITNDEARLTARATSLPIIDATRDVGLFVARASDDQPRQRRSAESGEETARRLREWGHARGSGKVDE